MEIRVKANIGNVEYEFNINENKEIEGLHKAIVLGNPKLYCDECKNTSPQAFRMDSNKDKESNIYINVVCRKCGAKSKLGQYKSGGYFWHKFEKYQKDGENKTVERSKDSKETSFDSFLNAKDEENNLPF